MREIESVYSSPGDERGLPVSVAGRGLRIDTQVDTPVMGGTICKAEIRFKSDAQRILHHLFMDPRMKEESGSDHSEPFSVPGTGHVDSAKSIDDQLGSWWIVKETPLDLQSPRRMQLKVRGTRTGDAANNRPPGVCGF